MKMITLLMLAVAAPAAAQPPVAQLPVTQPPVAQPTDNAAPLAAARALEAAERDGDRAALDRLIAPDFLFVGANGRIGAKPDYVDGFASAGSRLEALRIVDPLFVRVSADVAIVGGEAWLKGALDGRPFVQHFRYADTLARRDGRWVAVYRQVTQLPLD